MLAGCSTQPKTQEQIQAERYHIGQDKGLFDIDIRNIPDAVPRAPEGSVKSAPYTFNGVRYKTLKTAAGYRKKGMASWYGAKFHGYKTANGEIYDMYAMTAAHKTLPLPSYARVTNLKNNRSVIVRVNDRGPFHGNRKIDLSWAAAKRLDYHQNGTASVLIEGIDTSPEGLLAFQRSQEKEPVSADDESDQLYLQVAALGNRDNANALKEKLVSVIDTPVHIRTSESDKLHRVRVGPISSESELSILQQRLQDARLGQGHKVYE